MFLSDFIYSKIYKCSIFENEKELKIAEVPYLSCLICNHYSRVAFAEKQQEMGKKQAYMA